MNKNVQAKFETYPHHVRPKIEYLRHLIFDVAKHDDAIGELEETLKWGEPSYLTTQSKTGTTIRIDWKPKSPDQYAIYVNCQTTLVDEFRSLFPQLTCEGSRAVIFSLEEELPEQEVRSCVRMALRYHLDKKKGR